MTDRLKHFYLKNICGVHLRIFFFQIIFQIATQLRLIRSLLIVSFFHQCSRLFVHFRAFCLSTLLTSGNYVNFYPNSFTLLTLFCLCIIDILISHRSEWFLE